jgi:hypothetical protein
MGEYPEVTFVKYDVNSMYGSKLFYEAYDVMGLDSSYAGTPFVIIGNYVFNGNPPGYQDTYRTVLDYYQDNFYNDTFGVYLGNAEAQVGEDKIKEYMEPVKIPFFGEVDLINGSLFGITFMLGIADGFNPCAMWVLIFLISIMLTMKDRKRMWILGLTFIGTSAAIYFLFMAAWLNVALLFGNSVIIRTLIGLFAIGMGLLSLRSWHKNRKKTEVACEVTDGAQKKKITDKIIKFTKEKSLILAIIGIVTLAISVNIVELLCSLGLPLIYTNFLTLADLSKPTYYFYLLLYTFFFMLDDIVVFSIAMYTMKVTSGTEKFTKFSKFIGGIVMILIGLALLFAVI